MATGSPDANGIWIYGEDDSEATFSALLNKLGNSTSTAIGSLISGMEVRQVVQNYTYTTVANSTTTFADTGLTVTITPQYSESKILVIVEQAGISKSSANPSNSTTLQLLKNGTVIYEFARDLGYTGTSIFLACMTASTAHLDTASSTSAITYKTQFRNSLNASSVSVQDNALRSTITAIEVRP